MKNFEPLKKIQDLFTKAEISCSLFDAEDPYPIPRLVVFGDLDSIGRERHLEITVQPLILKEAVSEESAESSRWGHLQFDCPFPFTVQDTAMADVAQFLHVLNLQLEFPGFFLSYGDNCILYRYTLVYDLNHPPETVILSLSGFALFIHDAYGDVLEKLALGKATFLEMLQEIQDSLKEYPEEDNSQ